MKGKFSSTDNFVISVEKEPRVLTPRSMKLKSSELDDLFDWVKMNYDDLMQMWNMYESGEDATEVILSLKKL